MNERFSRQIFCPSDFSPTEKRRAMTPTTVKRWLELGCTVQIPMDYGTQIGFDDNDYAAAGAVLAADPGLAMAQADILLRVKTTAAQLAETKLGAWHLSFLDPVNEQNMLQQLNQRALSVFSLEMMPRTTLAQSMDALSSQANLAGYAAVLAAAERSSKVLPMMTTPAGSISPARVLVLGAGVAGLQA
ncbi:MAG: NAD(P)(+) transhydrogenase (Re/Si-specific) subunit alpha, partial [Verrucomicrobiales bacterium]